MTCGLEKHVLLESAKNTGMLVKTIKECAMSAVTHSSEIIDMRTRVTLRESYVKRISNGDLLLHMIASNVAALTASAGDFISGRQRSRNAYRRRKVNIEILALSHSSLYSSINRSTYLIHHLRCLDRLKINKLVQNWSSYVAADRIDTTTFCTISYLPASTFIIRVRFSFLVWYFLINPCRENIIPALGRLILPGMDECVRPAKFSFPTSEEESNTTSGYNYSHTNDLFRSDEHLDRGTKLEQREAKRAYFYTFFRKRLRCCFELLTPIPEQYRHSSEDGKIG
ncbi:unnamed protein product [Albugo candida]|uniref:Uncharacterized protein n=1 Tax=Albugo candida TaxID=65357 RepID=A0A024G0F3_9STRA|nr:unnamed protein product [Albugo candida]|eukprot:CCI40244.1 unnamed protein product [Albugo candida]